MRPPPHATARNLYLQAPPWAPTSMPSAPSTSLRLPLLLQCLQGRKPHQTEAAAAKLQAITPQAPLGSVDVPVVQQQQHLTAPPTQQTPLLMGMHSGRIAHTKQGVMCSKQTTAVDGPTPAPKPAGMALFPHRKKISQARLLRLQHDPVAAAQGRAPAEHKPWELLRPSPREQTRSHLHLPRPHRRPFSREQICPAAPPGYQLQLRPKKMSPGYQLQLQPKKMSSL